MDNDPSSSGSRFSTPSDAVEGILQRAFAHAGDGEWNQMAELLRDALEAHADDPYVLCWLGVAERELGMDGVAYERFRRALEADPSDPVLLATAGNAVAAFDDPQAEAALRTAALIAPDLPQARWMYGAYLSREGMIEQAMEELDAAVELDPEDAVIHLERGVAQSMGGDLQAAEFSFARSAELAEGEGWGLLLLGLCRILLGELEEALRPLEDAARIRPDDLEAQLLAALALSASGWADRSLEMLERARLRAEGLDEALVQEAESRMEDGPEGVQQFLRESLAPSSFRERLIQRP